MRVSPQSPNGQPGSMRALGCVGFVFSTGLVLLGLALISQYRIGPATDVVVFDTPTVVTAVPVPTDEARALSAKIQPPTVEEITSPVVPSDIDRQPVPADASDDLRHLMQGSPPPHDYFAMAEQLGGFEMGKRQIEPQYHTVGDRQTFQTADGPRQADLVVQTDFAAYWVETGLSVDVEMLSAAADNIEHQYFNALWATFGREWTPGVDQDPHIHILHMLGSPTDFELGYFSDENEFPRSLFIHSNERELIYLNMSRLEIGSDLYTGTVLHELQHLSQWNMDTNEEVWLNEGLSQLAETMLGFSTVDPSPYSQQPGIRLDRWSNAPDEIYAHYAASYLYMMYLWQRAGEAAVRELVRHPANGLASVQAILEGHLPGVTLAQFTTDWATATYLDGNGGQGDMAYDNLDLPSPSLATRARRLPFSTLNELDQFAVDYIDLDLAGPVRVKFIGDTAVGLITAPPPSGGRFWFASAGNSSDSALTATVDLTTAVNPGLTFDTWYDLEPGWDFAYLSVSPDNGQTWEVVPSPSGIVGQYGPAWSGISAGSQDGAAGWIRESVSLTDYVGQTVLVRFNVLSDFERPSRGFAIADAHMTEAGAHSQPVDWQPVGFTETGWLMSQEWGVRVIRNGSTAEVIEMTPDATGLAQADVVLGQEGGVVVIVPLTAPATDAAKYWLSVESLAGAGAPGDSTQP